MRVLLLSRETEGPLLCSQLRSLGVEVELQFIRDFEIGDDYDLVISHHYPFIIKGTRLERIQKFVSINVHNTYLPFGRGVYGIMWAAAMN